MENSQESHPLNVLVKMANQIASNIAPGDSQENIAQATADHLMHFWARSMKLQIINSLKIKDNQLEPNAAEAVKLLKKSYTHI